MLDEAWLKARRIITQSLEENNLWIYDEEYLKFMQRQKLQGERLKKKLLHRILGSEYVLLGSEGSFSSTNRHFQLRLPYCLSFGYEIGTHICNLFNKKAKNNIQVAQLSALFNLGISVFDLIIDHYPNISSVLNSVFNERVLKRLIFESSQEQKKMKSAIQQLNGNEIKILLKLIAGFFKNLNDSFSDGRQDEIKNILLPELIKAYKAELISNNLTKLSLDLHSNISRRKSTLPFIVISKLIIIANNDININNLKVYNKFIKNFAESFWILDDILDIVKDIRTGALNSVLVKAQLDLNLSCDNNEETRNVLISQVLKENYIEEASIEFLKRVLICFNILKHKSFNNTFVKDFSKFYLIYIRDWMI